MSIIFAQASMLGNLRSRSRVDYTLDRLNDDVGDGRIVEWVAESQINETLAVDDVINFQRGTLGLKAVDSFFGVFVVGQKDERDIVRLWGASLSTNELWRTSERWSYGLECNVDTSSISHSERINFAILGGINGCLAVL